MVGCLPWNVDVECLFGCLNGCFECKMSIQCSKSCGGGTQTRPVTCRDHLGQTLPDHRCHPAGRPEYSQNCHIDPCPTEPPVPEKSYRWKTAAWTTVGELNSTSTETTLSDARSDTNTTASLTLETSLSSPTKTFDSFDEQTTTDLIPTPTTTTTTTTTTVQFVTLTSQVSVAEQHHTSVTTTPTLTTLSTALDLSPDITNTSLYATSVTEFISAPVNATTIPSFVPSDPEIPVTLTTLATTPSTEPSSSSTLTSTTTVSSTELSSSSIGSSTTTSVSTVTMEPHRPVTFDWNSYTSPYGSMTPSTRQMTTSSSARLFPVSLPHRPTYAYFANYYRFDSPTVRHSRRPSDWSWI